MNWKLTSTLAGFAVVLGAYAYFVEAKKDAPPAPDSVEVRLWDLKEDKAVSRLVLEDHTGQKTEYRKTSEKDGWRYAPKASASLEAVEWDNPYGNLATFVADRKVADSVANLKDYGLDKPILKLAMGTEKRPDRYQVTVGGKTPLDSSAYYVSTNQSKAVYQVSAWKVDGWLKLQSSPPLASPSATASASGTP